jgi:hypothetical protein
VVHRAGDGCGGADAADLADSLGPIGLVCGSSPSRKCASIEPVSAFGAMWQSAKSWLTTCPNRGPITLCSCSASDSPWVIPPMTRERADLGLIIRPASCRHTKPSAGSTPSAMA